MSSPKHFWPQPNLHISLNFPARRWWIIWKVSLYFCPHNSATFPASLFSLLGLGHSSHVVSRHVCLCWAVCLLLHSGLHVRNSLFTFSLIHISHSTSSPASDSCILVGSFSLDDFFVSFFSSGRICDHVWRRVTPTESGAELCLGL